jgi:hypothetical protein
MFDLGDCRLCESYRLDFIYLTLLTLRDIASRRKVLAV